MYDGMLHILFKPSDELSKCTIKNPDVKSKVDACGELTESATCVNDV